LLLRQLELRNLPKLFDCSLLVPVVVGRPFVKRFALYAIGPVSCLSVLSVCNVGVLWPNGWADQLQRSQIYVRRCAQKLTYSTQLNSTSIYGRRC